MADQHYVVSTENRFERQSDPLDARLNAVRFLEELLDGWDGISEFKATVEIKFEVEF